MHFHVHSTPVIGSKNYFLLAQTLCVVFVDIFRMLYVLGSEEARAANLARFNYFLEVCDEHLRELGGQLARIANGIEDDERRHFTQIERTCLYVYGQIKRRHDVNFELNRCFREMSNATSEAYDLLRKLIPIEFHGAEAQVYAIAVAYTPHSQIGGIQNLRVRFSVQTRLLEDGKNEPVRTISHDASQSYALKYFLVDYYLLHGPCKGKDREQ